MRDFKSIIFKSIPLKLDLTGGLYIPDYKTLLVADLHFEKGSSLARFGVIIPPFDTRSTLETLQSVISRYQPETLILLGDSFHDRDAPYRLSNDDRQTISEISSQTDLLWITGNHDPDLPDDLPGRVANEITLGALTLRHEPSLKANGEICGHLHPAAIIQQRGRTIRRRCFAGNKERLFMPAFGAYTGGLNVKSTPYAPYWNNQPFIAWMIGKSSLHKFASSKLR